VMKYIAQSIASTTCVALNLTPISTLLIASYDCGSRVPREP
jgi:hypothetical protein